MADGQAGTHSPAPPGGQGELDEWTFDCGVAISVYQNSGGSNTQWETFERQKRWFGRPAIKVLLLIKAIPLGNCQTAELTDLQWNLVSMLDQACQAARLRDWPLLLASLSGAPCCAAERRELWERGRLLEPL